MKQKITVAGDITSGLAHFALAGLSLLARSLTNSRIVTYWNQDPSPRGVLEVDDVHPEQLAEQIRILSTRWATGWTSVRVKYAEGTFSPISPRFKAIDPQKHPDDWIEHQVARTNILDELYKQDDMLALQLIQGLGEAAYWRFDGKDPRPDHGASRWEMKTRNRGEEFVSQKLFKYVEELAEWSPDKILSGIKGESATDPFGKEDSRTPSGFTPPGETDLALAFTALLGIGQFPLTLRIDKMSVTPGAYPNSDLHPKVAVLPVSTVPITPERFESIALSKDWAIITQVLGSRILNRKCDASGLEETSTRLKQYGIPGAAVFRIHRGGSSTAPERYFEKGKIHLL